MWDWFVKHHRHVIVLLILILTFQLAYSDIFSRGPLWGPSRFLFEIGSSVVSGMAGGVDGMRKILDEYVVLVNVNKENFDLKHRLALLQMRLKLLEDIEIRYKNILNVLNLPLPQKNFSYVTAMVSGRDMNSIFKSMIVDKGELDGVKMGDGVISTSGVVGKVVKLTRHAAEVLLLTDAGSYIEGIDEQTRVRGIANGTAGDKLEFLYILSGDRIGAGDTILTGGKDGVFPEGIMLGTVTRVKPTPRGWLFKNVFISPAVDINRLNYVMIITGGKQ
ncbi:MAG: rod shape-determining protein MreC [Deltaproteobacteria bacterium]|nr:rod shape-determining protein MreC [Deltaproteobacteria bacterium]MCL5278068.1 rod shape-determining protein MreC [Deltaproteobacteria bacterium]